LNIVALVKQTSDMEWIIRMVNNDKSIVIDEVRWTINPYEEVVITFLGFKAQNKENGKSFSSRRT